MGNAIKELSTQDVLKRMKNKSDLVILDVREPREWAAGRIPNAKHIPLGEIPYRLHELDAKKETIVVCRSGNRSRGATEFLAEKGYNVMNMIGGMMEWPGGIERD